MNRGWRLSWFVVTTIVGAGCRAPVQIRPGLSAVRIEVRATPKRGYVGPSAQIGPGGDAYGMEFESATGPREAASFERVDYRALDDIVVWIEPRSDAVASESAQDEPPVVITVSAPSAQHLDVPLFVIGVGGRVEFVNRSGRDVLIYSVSDANAFDAGVLAPDGVASYRAVSPGLIEVLCESRDDPIAFVYVAPTRWAKRGRSGSDVVFTDLRPGRCRVSCWHRRLPGSNTDVVLVADKITRAVVSAGVNALPKVD